MTKFFDGDVDIDVLNRDHLLRHIRHVDASVDRQGTLEKHKVGIYVQDIPYNPLTNLANVDYKTAPTLGYQKIDILNVSIYEGIRDGKHLQQLIDQEPIWELLQHEEFVERLFHLNGHSKLVQKLKPDSVEKLAAVLAIIRPGKKHLEAYSWDKILSEVWLKPENGEYYYKRSHAISYAVAIVVQMNLLAESAFSN